MDNPIATKPVFWKRIYYRFCFGKDMECDSCRNRLWWKGNRIIAGNTEVFLCNKCEYEIFPLFSQGNQETETKNLDPTLPHASGRRGTTDD